MCQFFIAHMCIYREVYKECDSAQEQDRAPPVLPTALLFALTTSTLFLLQRLGPFHSFITSPSGVLALLLIYVNPVFPIVVTKILVFGQDAWTDAIMIAVLMFVMHTAWDLHSQLVHRRVAEEVDDPLGHRPHDMSMRVQTTSGVIIEIVNGHVAECEMCTICLESHATVVLMPCTHPAFCSSCALRWMGAILSL